MSNVASVQCQLMDNVFGGRLNVNHAPVGKASRGGSRKIYMGAWDINVRKTHGIFFG